MLHDDLRTILVSESENGIEENQIVDVEMEKKNKIQLLFYKNFKFFLKVLKDYYFLCMVKRICKTMMIIFIDRLLKTLNWRKDS